MGPRARREQFIGYLSLGTTLCAVIGGCVYWCRLTQHAPSAATVAEIATFGLIAVSLLYGNIVYQMARVRAVGRESRVRSIAVDPLENLYDGPSPLLTVLIPSYKEEPAVLRQTLLSAALVEYPNRRVVVLIDDPPGDSGRTWDVIEESRQFLARSSVRFEEELAAFERRRSRGKLDKRSEARRIARLYEDVADILEQMAVDIGLGGDESTHVDDFFRMRVLLAPAATHRARAAELRRRSISSHRAYSEYRRLAALLKADIEGFERKQWLNLSHEPNKAMNLNAYIGLLGRNLRRVETNAGKILLDAGGDEADLIVPDSDFLLTLDADSLVDAKYALQLVEIMRSDERIAVAQTPYSAVPGAPGLLERVAGATTDIQYIAHQGYVPFGATYWVGANAILRVVALRDIRTTGIERGYEIPIFIQDRTVIEDTGSTIDLIRKGWVLYNHPERLAYSATPPDFGSLVIQRRRWSNGGLIILPDLIGYFMAKRPGIGSWLELFVRAHYLLSPMIGSLGVLALLLYPFDPTLAGLWLPLGAAPYYYVYGRDLVRIGYSWSDLLRVYSLNLLLIPINLAGVLRSLQQAITGKKAPFGRTPKVANRTATAPLYILFNGFLALFLCFSSFWDFLAGHYDRALFCGFNGSLFVYGFHAYIGWRESWVDLVGAVGHWWARFDRIDQKARPRRRAAAPGFLAFGELEEAKSLEAAE